MVNEEVKTPDRNGGGAVDFVSKSDMQKDSCLIPIRKQHYQIKGGCDSMNNQLLKKEKMMNCIRSQK
jgi:hypothetical protein